MATRNTIQRQLVIAAVRTLEKHPTADEVYQCIAAEYPDISKGTVYRNLNSLVDSGLLQRVAVPSGADRFDHILTKHYHLQCTQCGAFTDLDVPYIDELDAKIAKVTGYKMDAHAIIFKGICPKCQKANTKKALN